MRVAHDPSVATPRLLAAHRRCTLMYRLINTLLCLDCLADEGDLSPREIARFVRSNGTAF